MKKIINKILAVCLIFILSACGAGTDRETTAEDFYIMPLELSEEAAKDLEFLKQYIASTVSQKEYGFIYIEDQNGNPVENLKCYNEGEWYVPDGEEAGKHSSVSLPGGIVPVSLLYEEEKVFLTIVNEEAESFLYQNVEADYERLKNGEIYKVVWEQESPEESVLRSEDYVKINFSSDFYPIERFTVQVEPYDEQPADEEDPEREANPAIGMISMEKAIKADTMAETVPQLGTFEKSRSYYVGNDGIVVMKKENMPQTEKIKFVVSEMDPHIIPTAGAGQWEFVFENGKRAYAIDLQLPHDPGSEYSTPEHPFTFIYDDP